MAGELNLSITAGLQRIKTMRTITGKELDKAILRSQGRTWDGMPLIKLSIGDLKQDAIQLFKEKAVKRGRLTDEEVKVSDTGMV